jgi:hypothetical protein
LDFGAGVSNVITRIDYCPRSGFEGRMVGGVFQGANLANFSGAVTFGTVATQPAAGVFTPVSVTNTGAFRYVRYLSPNGGYGNVAELEFYGYQFVPLSLPVMRVALTGTNLTVSWPLASAGYTVQSRTNLSEGNWVNLVSPTPQIVGSEWQVTVSTTANEPSTFYRLAK